MNKRYLLTILAVWFTFAVFGNAPKYDAVYKLISKSYTLNTDGSTDFRMRTELQLFTQMTFDEFGETFITYNPDFQELIINEAYTIRKDGSKVETPANAFNPMLPESCTKCERLNGIRTMVVTHTALEYDAVIVLDYTIHSKNFFFQELMEKVDLQEPVPVEKYVVSVTVPDTVKFNLNGENLLYTKTESTDKDDNTTTVWTFTDLPEMPTDEYLFPSAVASLTFFTLFNKEDIINRIRHQYSMNKFDNQIVTEFFRNRSTEKTSDIDKILLVRDYIHDYIRTNDVDAKVLNYMFASPQQVWESNCATPIEKDILLAGVLQSLGYNAELAFVRNSLPTDLETVVRIKNNDGEICISANQAEDLNLKAYSPNSFIGIVSGSALTRQPEAILAQVSADITFENGELDNPTVEVKHKNVISPMIYTLQPQEISVAKVSVSQFNNNYYELTIDDGNYGTQVQSVNIHNDRKYDINTGQSDEKYSYTITLPANTRCLTKPVHKEITVENAKLLIDIQVDGQTVIITRQLSLPQGGISAKNVKKFKAMMGMWDAPMKIMVATP